MDADCFFRISCANIEERRNTAIRISKYIIIGTTMRAQKTCTHSTVTLIYVYLCTTKQITMSEILVAVQISFVFHKCTPITTNNNKWIKVILSDRNVTEILILHIYIANNVRNYNVNCKRMSYTFIFDCAHTRGSSQLIYFCFAKENKSKCVIIFLL